MLSSILILQSSSMKLSIFFFFWSRKNVLWLSIDQILKPHHFGAFFHLRCVLHFMKSRPSKFDGRNYGSCLQTSACFSTRRTRFVFMELANAENSWLSTYSGFLFFSNHLRFCFRSKMSANDKRDYTCMTKLVSLIVVQSSGEWCGNEICRFLFCYFRNICDSCMRAVWRCRHIPCAFCLRFQSWT